MGDESKAVEHLREAVEQNSTPYVIVSHRAVAEVLTLLDAARALNEWACGELAAALNARDDARAEREAAQAALVALVETETTVDTWGGYAECAFCGRACHLDNPLHHADDCPWLRARALAEAQGGEGE